MSESVQYIATVVLVLSNYGRRFLEVGEWRLVVAVAHVVSRNQCKLSRLAAKLKKKGKRKANYYGFLFDQKSKIKAG